MNIALIIGNGFDLSLGLPTSFSHFIKSKYFRKGLMNNDLYQYMDSVYNSNMGWIDVESELANYSMEHPKSTTLRIEYHQLKQALADYMGEIDYNHDVIDKDSSAYNSFGDYFFSSVGHKPTNKLIVINFNYTHSILKLKRNLYGNGFLSKFLEIAEAFSPLMGNDNPFSHIKFIHPHGAVDTGIVFGVDDGSLISPKHTFLKKSCDPSYLAFNPTILSNADKIVIWGHSLGESDHAYFVDFFTRQSSSSASRKEIVITYYGEEGYESIIEQLDILTNHNIRGLKINNRLKLIDSSSEDCRWKL